jgi:RimJ/RimL family protein N-acetyltransferase
MLHLVVDRPILARAATDNIGSIRVLQKCGFKIIGKNKDFANGRRETPKNTFFAWISIEQMNELA